MNRNKIGSGDLGRIDPPKKDTNGVDLSIVICTWNNSDRLSKTLSGIGQCEAPNGVDWEVVIVDNNSTDDTAFVISETADQLPLVYVFEPRQGLSRARNAGLKAASGQLVIFTDDDIKPASDWIRHYWSAFLERPTGFFFGGPVKSRFEADNLDQELLQFAPASVNGLDWGADTKELNSSEYFIGANWACPADALEMAGGFDTDLGLNPNSEGIRVGEETALMECLKTRGITPLYLPGAEIEHLVTAEKTGLFHIASRFEASAYYFGRMKARKERGAAITGVPIRVLKNYLSHWIKWAVARASGRKAHHQYINLRKSTGLLTGLRDRSQGAKTFAGPSEGSEIEGERLKLAYANAFYTNDGYSRANQEVGQFITNAASLGHQVWTWPDDEHPIARPIPSARLGRILALRRMDLVVIRVDLYPPGPSRWAMSPLRQIIRSPLVVWELNAVPELGLLMGQSNSEVERSIELFKHYGQGCDLAICASQLLADHARECYGIERAVYVPRGSDPELFSPSVPPVGRIERNTEWLNVVWIGRDGSAGHNLDLLFRAARIIWDGKAKKYVKFHIVGQNLPSMRDLSPNINCYGPESYEALPRWLASMDVGLCLYTPGPPDYWAPLEMLDYMASGLAVVATPQPQVNAMFEDLGQSNLLVPHDDPAILAQALTTLSKDRQRVRALGDAGRQHIVDFYNFRRSVRETFHEIDAVLRDGRSESLLSDKHLEVRA